MERRIKNTGCFTYFYVRCREISRHVSRLFSPKTEKENQKKNADIRLDDVCYQAPIAIYPSFDEDDYDDYMDYYIEKSVEKALSQVDAQLKEEKFKKDVQDFLNSRAPKVKVVQMR